MEILIGFLGHFTLGLIIGTIIATVLIEIYKQFKKK